MAEDKNKKKIEAELNDEQLDEAAGGVNKELKNPNFIRS